jgi:hypothetical protein
MKRILLSLILLSTTISSFSQIFLKDGIYYSMLSDNKTVEVTSNNFGAYSGDVNIPSTVQRDGDAVTYKVTAIGNKAFYGCSKLTDIYSYISKPDNLYMGYGIFYASNKVTVHVLSGLADTYRTNNKWSRYFSNFVEDLTEGISNIQSGKSFRCHASDGKVFVTSDKVLNGISVYDIDGKLITSSPEKSNSYAIPVNAKTFIVKSGHDVIKINTK